MVVVAAGLGEDGVAAGVFSLGAVKVGCTAGLTGAGAVLTPSPLTVLLIETKSINTSATFIKFIVPVIAARSVSYFVHNNCFSHLTQVFSGERNMGLLKEQKLNDWQENTLRTPMKAVAEPLWGVIFAFCMNLTAEPI